MSLKLAKGDSNRKSSSGKRNSDRRNCGKRKSEWNSGRKRLKGHGFRNKLFRIKICI